MSVPEASRSPDQSEVILAGVHYVLQDMHTGLPGKIVKWDPAKQVADVQVLVKRVTPLADGGELAEELPILPDVPVQFVRSGTAFMSFPLEVGDFVWLKFGDMSLDAYLAGDGNVVDPGDFRRFDLSDAIAEPGMAPLSRALKDVHGANVVIGFDNGGCQIHITPDGKMEVKVNGAAAKHVAVAEALQTFWDGPFKAWMIAHQHPTGVGPSGPPITAGAFPIFDVSIISAMLAIQG